MEPTVTATEARIVRAFARAGGLAALAGAALTLLWVATLIANPPPGDASTADHLRALLADDVGHSIGYAVTLPLAFLFVPVWMALAVRAWRAHPVAAALTVAFGLLYTPFPTIAYFSQLTAARGVAATFGSDPAAALAAYQLFDFGTRTSLTSAIDVAGYAVLAIGTLAASILVWPDGRAGRVAAVSLALSGGLSIAGAVGTILRWPPLEAGAVLSGLPFLVAIALVPAILLRDARLARTA